MSGEEIQMSEHRTTRNGKTLVVAGILMDFLGRYLLVKKPEGWCFPGGKVEVGEGEGHALQRELREETGLNISVDDFRYTYEGPSPSGRFHVRFYAYRPTPFWRLFYSTQKEPDLPVKWGTPEDVLRGPNRVLFCQMVHNAVPMSGHKRPPEDWVTCDSCEISTPVEWWNPNCPHCLDGALNHDDFHKWGRFMVGKTVVGNGRCCRGNQEGHVYTLTKFVEEVGDFWTHEHDATPGGCRWMCPNGFGGPRWADRNRVKLCGQ